MEKKTQGILILIIAAASACGEYPAEGFVDESQGIEVGVARQQLGIPTDWWQPWPTGVIPYCYQPSAPASGYPQPGSSAFNTSVQATEDAIVQYETIPDAAIDFQGGELCPNWASYTLGTDPETLRIVITQGGGGLRFCQPNVTIANGEPVDGNCTGGHSDELTIIFGGDSEATILHELGHALGFNHEYWRRPGTEDDCDPESTLGASNGMTAYDVYSVMNATYCHWRSNLSSLDEVGLAFAYPGAGADQIVVPFSFPLAGTLLTGSGDAEVLEFAQRLAGVEEHHYSSASWQRQIPVGYQVLATASSVSLGTALGTSSEATIRARFADGFGRLRSTPPTLIRQDAGLAAALVLSAT